MEPWWPMRYDELRAENERLFKIIEQVCDASEQWQRQAEKAEAEVERLRADYERAQEDANDWEERALEAEAEVERLNATVAGLRLEIAGTVEEMDREIEVARRERRSSQITDEVMERAWKAMMAVQSDTPGYPVLLAAGLRAALEAVWPA